MKLHAYRLTILLTLTTLACAGPEDTASPTEGLSFTERTGDAIRGTFKQGGRELRFESTRLGPTLYRSVVRDDAGHVFEHEADFASNGLTSTVDGHGAGVDAPLHDLLGGLLAALGGPASNHAEALLLGQVNWLHSAEQAQPVERFTRRDAAGVHAMQDGEDYDGIWNHKCINKNVGYNGWIDATLSPYRTGWYYAVAGEDLANRYGLPWSGFNAQCVGMCGEGCVPFGGGFMDCFEHDLCTLLNRDAAGNTNGLCGDEFNEAINDFIISAENRCKDGFGW